MRGQSLRIFSEQQILSLNKMHFHQSLLLCATPFRSVLQNVCPAAAQHTENSLILLLFAWQRRAGRAGERLLRWPPLAGQQQLSSLRAPGDKARGACWCRPTSSSSSRPAAVDSSEAACEPGTLLVWSSLTKTSLISGRLQAATFGGAWRRAGTSLSHSLAD